MKKLFVTALLPLILAACTASPLPDILPWQTPDDPTLGTANARFQSVIGEYEHREPTDPKSWRKLNESQAPNKENGS